MDRFGEKVCCNPTVKLKKQESYPVIDIDKITPGYKTVKSVESLEYTGQGGAKFQDHDVLFARITPCLENGKMAIADTEGQSGIGSTELFVFRGIEGVSDTDYIYYLLRMKHIRQLAANSMTGASGRQRADLHFIKRIQWDFPDIEMQKKIVTILSTYDNLIEVNNKRIKVLEQMAENLYKEWFVRFRFPGHETAEFENDIPKEWEILKISNIASIKAGGDRPEVYSEYPVEGITTPIYSNGLDNDGLYGYTDKAIITEQSVTISARGTVGFVCLRRVPYVPIVRLIAIVPDTRVVTPMYLYYYLQRDSVIANGTSQQQITVPMVSRKRILVPPKAIQEKLNELEMPIWYEMDCLRGKNNNLIQQRDMLLPRLMSGKLEVPLGE